MSGPARGRRGRVGVLRAALPCLALIAFDAPFAQAQTVTPDLFRPERDGFVTAQNSPLRKTGDRTRDSSPDPSDPANDPKLRDKDTPAPSRIGQIPTYGLPAASGAAGSGFDSLNRTRKKPKLYPGQAKPKPSPGPGTPAPVILRGTVSTAPPRLSIPPSETANKAPIPPAMAGTVTGQPPRTRL